MNEINYETEYRREVSTSNKLRARIQALESENRGLRQEVRDMHDEIQRLRTHTDE